MNLLVTDDSGSPSVKIDWTVYSGPKTINSRTNLDTESKKYMKSLKKKNSNKLLLNIIEEADECDKSR